MASAENSQGTEFKELDGATFQIIIQEEIDENIQDLENRVKEGELINSASAIKPALLLEIVHKLRQFYPKVDNIDVLDQQFQLPNKEYFDLPVEMRETIVSLRELIELSLGDSLNFPIYYLKNHLLDLYIKNGLIKSADLEKTHHKKGKDAEMEVLMNQLQDNIRTWYFINPSTSIVLRDSTDNEVSAYDEKSINRGNTSSFQDLFTINMSIFRWAYTNKDRDPLAKIFYDSLLQKGGDNPTREHELKTNIQDERVVILGKSGLYYNQSKENILHLNDFAYVIVIKEGKEKRYRVGWSIKKEMRTPKPTSEMNTDDKERIEREREEESLELIQLVKENIIPTIKTKLEIST